jgi:hypothetical protein
VSELKIGIILGSTRRGRNGKAVADWVLDKARARIGADYYLIDLADHPLPHMDEPMSPMRPIRRRAHRGVGRDDRPLRRVCRRHARVQPLHFRCAGTAGREHRVVPRPDHTDDAERLVLDGRGLVGRQQT